MLDISEEDQISVAEYVMGLLDQPDAAALEKRLKGEAALLQEYHGWINQCAALNTKFLLGPPSTAFPAISRRLFGTPVRQKLPLWVKIAALVGAATILSIKLMVIVEIVQYLGF